MKYKVSVIKKIAFLVMTMALAVAMVACQAATTGAQGNPGPEGQPGEPGDQGPPGESANESPVFTAPTDMIYLAMAGTGAATKSDSTDLSNNFKDAERINLEYRVKSSSDEAVATAKVVMDKMLEVTAKGVGSATITVEALDGVNQPVEGTFGVTVVESNTAPTSSVLTPGAGNAMEALQPLLYISSGALKVTIDSDARAGVASGIDDELVFDAKMGAAGTGDDIISFSAVPGSKVGTWDVTLTPLKSGKQQVKVAITDKFGAAVELTSRWEFIATVNTPPSLEKEAEDMTIVAGTTVVFSVAEHFDISVKAPSPGPDPVSDSDPTLETAPTGGATDSPTVCSATTVPPQTSPIDISGGTFNLPAAVGTYDLTVTCQDAESAVHTTAKITVRAAI